MEHININIKLNIDIQFNPNKVSIEQVISELKDKYTNASGPITHSTLQVSSCYKVISAEVDQKLQVA